MSGEIACVCMSVTNINPGAFLCPKVCALTSQAEAAGESPGYKLYNKGPSDLYLGTEAKELKKNLKIKYTIQH